MSVGYHKTTLVIASSKVCRSISVILYVSAMEMKLSPESVKGKHAIPKRISGMQLSTQHRSLDFNL
jgi:hypothetical protein